MKEIKYVKDTFEEYLGKKDHISASDIKNFLKSPKIYWDSKYGKKKETKARHFAVGSAIHELILEPHQFHNNYVVVPKVNKTTKVGKAAWAEFLIEANGRTIITEEEMDIAINGAEQSSLNDTLVEFIKNSYRELSCYTVDIITGLKIKLRPDILCKNKSVIVDIKTCMDSSYNSFKYSNVNGYMYWISAAYYGDFLNKENYVFCAIEKAKPYQTSLYVLNDDYIEKGRAKYRMALDLIKWSYDNNYWCNYFEFGLLCECYELGNIKNFFEILKESEKIKIITL